MKRLQNIFLAVISFAVVSCVEDITTDMPSANSGDEVQFGLSLDGLTRTAYGTENTEGTAFPIYWVNGDKVLVASPQCLTGRNSAEYQVSVAGAAQNYADNLTKTGDAGVQWGSSDATFYSVYPSANTSLTIDGTNVTATMNIASTQSVNYTLVDGTYYAASMENVAMYAKTSSISKGSVVNLNYKPLSTVIEFELNVGTEATGSIFIESLILEAGENNIAGEFTFDFSTATYGTGENQKQYPVVTSTSGSNTITMEFATQPELDKTNPVLKAKMCLMPVSGVTSLDGWIVKANVRTGADNTKATYKKTIATATDKSTALIPGLVHKVKLPILPTGDAWEYKPGEWMPQLPNYRNIYLTELSIPGAWYAGAPVTDGYQLTDNIQELWNAGIRAFAVETKTAVQSLTSYTDPAYVVVSGTGYSSVDSPRTGSNSLVYDDLGAHHGYTNEAKSYYYEGGIVHSYENAIRLSTIIENIAKQVTATEFGVLILSYADGGEGGHRYIDHGAWLNLISAEIATFQNNTSIDASIKNKIYTKDITPNTIVDDVLGKLIIKVNVDTNIAKEGYSIKRTTGWDNGLVYSYSIDSKYTYSGTTPTLLSYNPFISQIGNNYYTTPLFSKLFWKTWEDTNAYRSYYTDSNTTDFWWCFNSANRTHQDGTGTYTIPTYTQRKAALNAMIEHSKGITTNSAHNVWFYFNAGGVQASDQTTTTESGAAKTFAKEMNPWLLSVINNKTNGYTDDSGVLHPSEPSPLGIVMFNQCTNSEYKGPEIVQAIIEMNNKFKLQYAVQ